MTRKFHEIRHIAATGEMYIFRYTDDQQSELLRHLGRLASNPTVTFTWYDAAIVSSKVRKIELAKDMLEAAEAAKVNVGNVVNRCR